MMKEEVRERYVLSTMISRSKTRQQNIDFQTTILSRFDMIFIVKDEHNEQRDKVCSWILSLWIIL
jgi:DNA replicative helicase MCM subunit Mcm2 (Cdc46/Mcm family)